MRAIYYILILIILVIVYSNYVNTKSLKDGLVSDSILNTNTGKKDNDIFLRSILEFDDKNDVVASRKKGKELLKNYYFEDVSYHNDYNDLYSLLMSLSAEKDMFNQYNRKETAINLPQASQDFVVKVVTDLINSQIGKYHLATHVNNGWEDQMASIGFNGKLYKNDTNSPIDLIIYKDFVYTEAGSNKTADCYERRYEFKMVLKKANPKVVDMVVVCCKIYKPPQGKMEFESIRIIGFLIKKNNDDKYYDYSGVLDDASYMGSEFQSGVTDQGVIKKMLENKQKERFELASSFNKHKM